jgi:hypothetical protein
MENRNFPKTEKIEIRLRQDLADRLPKAKGEKNTFINQAVEHELDGPEWLSRAGKTITPAKSAAARENGKTGGRPPLVIKKEKITVEETKKGTSMKGGEKVSDPHVTGWWLSYEFPNGEITRAFYQRAAHSLKEAKHLFFKSCVEPRRTEFERSNK